MERQSFNWFQQGSRFLRKIQTPLAPVVHPKLILAAAVFPGRRSALVPGRSSVAKQAGIGLAKARRRSCIAVAGDGHTPPSIL